MTMMEALGNMVNSGLQQRKAAEAKKKPQPKVQGQPTFEDILKVLLMGGGQ